MHASGVLTFTNSSVFESANLGVYISPAHCRRGTVTEEEQLFHLKVVQRDIRTAVTSRWS